MRVAISQEEDPSHDVVHRSRSAHAWARSPWPKAQPWRDHRVFYVAVKTMLTPDWFRHDERHTALTLAEEEAHRSPALPHRTSSERHRLCFSPTTMAGATGSTRSSFNMPTMAVEAPWSSHAPPTGLSLPLQPYPCTPTNPRRHSPWPKP